MSGEEILLIKHQEHKNGRAYWLLPGGGIEDSETEVQCAEREVREETNLEVKVACLLLMNLHNTEIMESMNASKPIYADH